MTERNPWDATNDKILAEVKEYRDRARKARPVPQGQEKVTAAQARARMAAMTPEERAAFAAKVGMPKILELLGDA